MFGVWLVCVAVRPFWKEKEKDKGDIYIFDRENYQAKDHNMYGTNASYAEPTFSVSSKIMIFSSYAHFFCKYFVGFPYNTELRIRGRMIILWKMFNHWQLPNPL